VGYSVSDTALDRLQPENYPTGWLTTGLDKMSAEKLGKLRKIALVYDLETTTNFNRIPSPVRFSPGACGYAFQDQQGRSIFLIWRQGRGPGSKDERNAGDTGIDCTVSFDRAADGTYPVEDLFDASQRQSITIAGGKGSFNFRLDRWDCRAFSSTIPAPRQKVQ
jgi:hypothetical protein